MANEEHVGILKEGVEAWNEWRLKRFDRTSGGDLTGASLRRANLMGINLESADLREADLTDTDLRDADLRAARCERTLFNGANFAGARLRGARFSMASFRLAKLAGQVIAHADFSHADMTRADLTGVSLSGVGDAGDIGNFISASMAGGNVTVPHHDYHDYGADLIGTIFDETLLAGADITRAKLAGACFRDVDLTDVDLTGVRLQGTIFANCDLSSARGLEWVRHAGPSTVGVDTIYRSNGRIPEAFLRGCGLPEMLISQMQALVGAEDGIQFYSCFISYSSKDEEFAQRLHGRMRDAHVRVWIALEDMKAGRKLHEEIDEAIRVYDKLLIVLSEASLQSEWVMTELRKARKAERQSGKRKLFPVRLVDYETLRDWECFDADSGKDLAVELREYFIPDFSHWKEHDQFESAFARLLKDLKAETDSR